MQKGGKDAVVSRSLSVPGRSVLIVRLASFDPHKKNVPADNGAGTYHTLVLTYNTFDHANCSGLTTQDFYVRLNLLLVPRLISVFLWRCR